MGIQYQIQTPTMKVPFYLYFVLVGLSIQLCQASKNDSYASSYDKRCKYFSFLSACKIGCKATGHTTGACDENDKCWCSENDFNFFKDVGDWIDKLDISDVISNQINKFKRKIDKWDVSENLKTLVPSKCKISESFCSKACHAIGKKKGTCNADFTDCDCSDDFVTPKQYGLCAMDTVCNLRCMKKKFARGDCVGEKGAEWDCKCFSQNDVEVDADITDIEYENFDA